LIYRKDSRVSAEDRAMLAREVRRIGNKIAYKEKVIKEYQDEIPKLEARQQELLDKIAAMYEDKGSAALGGDGGAEEDE
jgi:hypothetical protein